MKVRGEYRPIYTALLDGADFQKLDAAARWTLVALKISLPATGIGVIPGLAAAISDRTALPVSVTEGALGTLVREPEGCPWVAIEANVVWLIRGLEFEPTMNVNDRKHRAHVARTLQALPSRKIIKDFVSHYAAWFPNDQPGGIEASTKGPAGAQSHPSDKPGSTSPSPSPSTTTEPHTAREPLFERLVERLAGAENRWAVVELFERVPVSKRMTWAATVNGYLDGNDLPGQTPATVVDLCLAAKDYGDREPNDRLFRRFVVAAIRDRVTDAALTAPAPGLDAKTARSVAALQEFAAEGAPT